MNQSISKELVTRIKSDAVISKWIAGIAIAGAFIYLVQFVTTLLAKNHDGINVEAFAGNFVKFGCIAGVLVVLSVILNEICKTGKPFTVSIAKKFKVMAFVLILAVPLAILTSCIAGVFDPHVVSVNFEISFADIAIMCFGVIVGIISEIFHYGVKLEDEMEMIA